MGNFAMFAAPLPPTYPSRVVIRHSKRDFMNNYAKYGPPVDRLTRPAPQSASLTG